MLGALDVAFKPTSEPPRFIQAYVLADSAKPTQIPINVNEAVANVPDPTGTISGARVRIGGGAGLLQPSAPTNHTLSVVAVLHCNSGSDGATATFGAVDVIGTKK